MTINTKQYSEFLERVAADLDIPPSKYEDAVERYQAVGRWLEDGTYPDASGEILVYPQGSFRLGTVVKPIRNGVEASYDIDLVFELPVRKDGTTPRSIKSTVGDRLREHGTYRRLLEPEGRRCWTLEYAEEDGIGFHLDVLPAVPDGRGPQTTGIAITTREDGGYSWSASDPRGYGEWFDTKNTSAFRRVLTEQKQAIQRRAPDLYETLDTVPDQLVRTPLQRAIQLMKRHRDMRFNSKDRVAQAPISIIITTLAAQLYGNESDVYSALTGIVERMRGHAALVENRQIAGSLAALRLIERRPDGTWYIGNPVNQGENFADRWHEDNHARARAFFEWAGAVHDDLVDVQRSSERQQVEEGFKRTLGAAAVSGNLHLLGAPASGAVEAPHIQISNPAKPWKKR